MGALADSAGRRTAMTLAGQSAVTYRWNNAKRLTIAQGSGMDLQPDLQGFADLIDVCDNGD